MSDDSTSEPSSPHDYEVVSSEVMFRGYVVTVRKDVVRMPGDSTGQRDVVQHPGAVAVVAIDDDDRVLLVNQYRHPVGRRLDELPAGLLDVEAEKALAAVQRELVEEAGFTARTWNVLVDHLSSPGMTDEAVRVYLARDLEATERQMQHHEELEMTVERVPLDEAVGRVLSGRIGNVTCAVGLLAADRARRDGYEGLRPADAPWPDRPAAGG